MSKAKEILNMLEQENAQLDIGPIIKVLKDKYKDTKVVPFVEMEVICKENGVGAGNYPGITDVLTKDGYEVK